MESIQHSINEEYVSLRSLNKAFQEYGQDVKEFQWLIYLNERTGDEEFPYEKSLDPFIQMAWLTRVENRVRLKIGDEFLIDKVYGEVEAPKKPAKTLRRPIGVINQIRESVLEVVEIPADFHINPKYKYQLTNLVDRFGANEVMGTAIWYGENKDQLEKRYQKLSYPQFMHYGMFQALQTWMDEGIPQKPEQEIDYLNRVI